MALVLGASKGRGSTPNLNHTCREVCVISLATSTIPVCRWIASVSNPADEPSRSKRYLPRMRSDVDQCGTAARESSADSGLLTVLSAEAAPVAGEEAQTRKPARDRPYAGAADLNKGRTDIYPKMTRRRRSCAAPPPRRVVFPEQNRVTAATVCLMASIKFVGWIQSFSDVLRAVRARGPLPWVSAAAMMV